MNRSRLLRPAQPRQYIEEAPDPRRCAGHRLVDRRHRRDLLPAQREDKGAHPLSRGVAAVEQGLERAQPLPHAPADREAERKPPARLVGHRPGQRGAIVALRRGLLAKQVVCQTSIGPEQGRRRAERLGLPEPGQRPARVAGLDQRPAHPDLGRGIARADLIGAAEEAGGGGEVAKLELGPAGGHQGGKVPRAGNKDANAPRQAVRRGLDNPGGRRRGRGRGVTPDILRDSRDGRGGDKRNQNRVPERGV